ncbi:hypothetical protein [Acetobacter sp.]|uniref:hypothetical protein n=1 Tax=Acetobacter sp. TaxID=440 RepID=UPI0039EAE77E
MDKQTSQGWFAVKRYGYGAGMPISWQGWVVFLLFLALTLIPTLTVPWLDLPRPLLAEGIVVFTNVVTTGVFVWVYKSKTNGEWRWRW